MVTSVPDPKVTVKVRFRPRNTNRVATRLPETETVYPAPYYINPSPEKGTQKRGKRIYGIEINSGSHTNKTLIE